MINDEKFIDLIKKLTTKSEANQVRWQQVGHFENCYDVFLSPGATLEILFAKPESEPDWVSVTLKFFDKELAKMVVEDGSPNYALVKHLYDDADRCVWGWDKALKQIEEALNSDEIIGRKPEPIIEKPATPVDDIPF